MFCAGAAKIGGERGRGDSGKMKEPQTNSAISLLQYAPAISYRLRKCWNDKVFKAIKYFLGCVYSKALFPVCDCKYSKYNQCTASCFFPKQKCVSAVRPHSRHPLLRPLGGQREFTGYQPCRGEDEIPPKILPVLSPLGLLPREHHSLHKKAPLPSPHPPARSLSTKSRSNRRRRKSPQQSVLLQRKKGRINVAAGKETF